MITVNTGDMILCTKKAFHSWQQPNNPDVFARCPVKANNGWHDVFRGNPGPFLYMKDQHGNYYDSCIARCETVKLNQIGTIYTQPFIFSGNSLRISADAVGSVKVTILG